MFGMDHVELMRQREAEIERAAEHARLVREARQAPRRPGRKER